MSKTIVRPAHYRRLFRIASTTRSYRAEDLSGAGAAKEPGRWNAVGEHVLYASQSIAMAVLETAAHVDDGGLPLNRFVVAIDVPNPVWKRRLALSVSELPSDWRAIPAGAGSEAVGSDWYRSGRSAIVLLPSVIVPEEQIVVINAQHADASQLRALTLRRFQYNSLFRR